MRFIKYLIGAKCILGLADGLQLVGHTGLLLQLRHDQAESYFSGFLRCPAQR
jgi:hypothetical protein